MSFLDTVDRARTFLERHRRVSLRALRREFELDPEPLAELSDELVQVQHVAVLEGDVLVWRGEEPPSPERDPRAHTPKHLADKILQSKSTLEGERKQRELAEAERPAGKVGALGLVPEIHGERAALFRRDGRVADARRELERARDLYREMGAGPNAARITPEIEAMAG